MYFLNVQLRNPMVNGGNYRHPDQYIFRFELIVALFYPIQTFDD